MHSFNIYPKDDCLVIKFDNFGITVRRDCTNKDFAAALKEVAEAVLNQGERNGKST